MDLPQVLITNNLFSGIDSFSFMAVPFFMLAGAFMSAGGVTSRLVNVAQAMVGSFTGGLAQAVAVAGMFFAAISGSSAATTAAIGSTMVNEMEQKGYKREMATGIVAAGRVRWASSFHLPSPSWCMGLLPTSRSAISSWLVLFRAF